MKLMISLGESLRVLAMTVLIFGVSACEDDNPELGPSGDNNSSDKLVEVPVDDVVETMVKYPVAVFESGYDEVSERLLARVTNRSTAVMPDTKVVLMNAADNFNITPDIWNVLKTVYDNGGIIMIANPGEGTRGWIEKSLQFSNVSPDPDGDGEVDWDGNPSTESLYDIYAFTKSGDRLELEDVYNPNPHRSEVVTVDSLGNKSVEIIERTGDEPLTPYQYGAFAESVAQWVNLTLDADAKAESSLRAAKRAGGSAADYFTNGEFKTQIFNLYLSLYQIDKDVDEQECVDVRLPVTVKSFISSAHNFGDGCDYYYLELTEEATTKTMWNGIKKHHPYGADGWSQAGWAIEGVDVRLDFDRGSGYAFIPDLVKYSPENSIGSKTITTTRGWNIGGGVSLGLSRADKWGINGSGSFSFTHVNTTAVAETVYDMDVEYKSALSDPSPQWAYTIPRFSLSGSFVGGISDVSGYIDGSKSINISQVVVWKHLPQIKAYDYFWFYYVVHSYMKRKNYAHKSKIIDISTTYQKRMDLPVPGRVRYNYSIVPVTIHDNSEWIQIMTILNDVSSYNDLKNFEKCSPVDNHPEYADIAAKDYYNEHYNILQNNCSRITNVKNTYELQLMNMDLGTVVSDKTLKIQPGGINNN